MEQIERLYNYRAVDASLATSGQPSVEQLQAVADDEFGVVINLALHDDPRYSLPDEPVTVASIGMKYVHIPVHFDSPTQQNLLAFFDAMDEHLTKRFGSIVQRTFVSLRSWVCIASPGRGGRKSERLNSCGGFGRPMRSGPRLSRRRSNKEAANPLPPWTSAGARLQCSTRIYYGQAVLAAESMT